MFRASTCSSSGGLIVLLQPLVLSNSVSGRLVHEFRAGVTSALNGRLQSGTIPEAAIIQLDLLKMSMVMLETCRGSECNILLQNKRIVH
jgi:hypothetical protein